LKEYENNSDSFTCPTFVQQKSFFKSDLKDKYLYKRNNIFYFSKRINGKPYKISLHSNNLKYCRMLRDKILQDLSLTEREQARIIKEDWGEEDFCYEVPIKIDNRIIRIDRILQSDYEVLKLVDNNEARKKLLEKLSNDARLVIKSIEFKNKKQIPISQQLQRQEEIPDSKSNDIFTNLDKYYNDYVEHKITFDKISDYSVKSYNASMRYLKYFIDEQTDFSFKFFKELQKKFQQMPKNFFKYPKYSEKNFDELLVIKEKENYDTLDNKTINNHIINWKNFFQYLKYEEYINENPLADIMALGEEKRTNKEEYTSEELDKIFSSNMDKEYLNMCKVALYSGLRIEEVLSIKKENIKDNSIHIDLEDSSSKKHQRIIPIHRNLVPSIEYQKKSNKGNYIFFSGNLENEVKNVGKRINRRLKNIIPIKEKTFHSFRKNFSQNIELNSNSEDKIKKYLMGHSQNKDITHAIYNRGKINIDKLVSCINDIDFEY